MMRFLPRLTVCCLLAGAVSSFGQAPPSTPETQTNVVTATQTNVLLVTPVPVPGPIPQSPSFSQNPTTDEIKRARVFGEPLVPMWGMPSGQENKAFAQAITAFANRSKPDDFSALTDFLKSADCDHWYPSLLFCLGREYYHTGFFSKALDAWENTWFLVQDESEPTARRLADRTVGELAKMYGRIGRAERLQEILDEIQDRRLIGSATEHIAGARQALWLMRNQPDVSFRCGPLALKSIALLLKPDSNFLEIIGQATSTSDGVSLLQLQKLSQDLKLNFQIAKRQPGASVPVPCVVHWGLDHYGALIQRSGDRYLLVDATFGNSLWISQAAIDAEASGYFLLPSAPLVAGWQSNQG